MWLFTLRIWACELLPETLPPGSWNFFFTLMLPPGCSIIPLPLCSKSTPQKTIVHSPSSPPPLHTLMEARNPASWTTTPSSQVDSSLLHASSHFIHDLPQLLWSTDTEYPAHSRLSNLCWTDEWPVLFHLLSLFPWLPDVANTVICLPQIPRISFPHVLY